MPLEGQAKPSCVDWFRQLYARLKEYRADDIMAVDARVPVVSGRLRTIVQQTDDKRWNEYAALFRRVADANIARNEGAYRDAIREGHPHIQFLREIGYEFKILPDGKLQHSVPDLPDMLASYETIMRKHVEAGRIKAEDVPVPLRGFQHRGKRIFLAFGEPIPTGAVPYVKTLTDADFREVARLRGYILGEPHMGGIAGPQSVIEHDLVHFGIFARRPELAAQVNQYNAALPPGRKGMQQRGFYLNELLDAVGKENRPRIVDLFQKHGIRSPTLAQNQPVKTEEIKAALSGKSDAELTALVDEVRSRRHELIEKLGAEVSDIVDRAFVRNEIKTNGQHQFRSVYLQLGPDGMLDLLPPASDPQYRDAVVKLVTALENTSHFQFDELVRELARETPDKSSPAYFYFCVNRTAQIPRYCR